MEYHFSLLPRSEAEIKITIPFSEFEPHLTRAATLISEEIEIEGFRRGKAPYDMVKNRVGEAKIYEQAAELAVRKTYPNVLRKLVEEKKEAGENFIPIGKPAVTITKLAPKNDLEYVIKLALLPSVQLSDYQEIAKRVNQGKKEVSVSDEEIIKTLAWLQDSRTKLITVDRAAEVGDAVEIDFEARHGNAKIEGGEAQNHPMIIGKGIFIPGFEDQLVGMKAGDEKKFILKVPESWHEKGFAGRALDFSTTMKLVQKQERPNLDDDFARRLGQFQTLDEVKKSISDGMTQEKIEKERERIRILIIEEIAGKAKIEVPPVLVDTELAKMQEELHSGVTSMGMKWDDYLSHINKTPDDLAQGWQEDAKKRVRIALTLRAIGEKENVAAGEEEVEARANQFLAQFRSAKEAEKNMDPEELREYARGILRNEKVFELLETM